MRLLREWIKCLKIAIKFYAGTNLISTFTFNGVSQIGFQTTALAAYPLKQPSQKFRYSCLYVRARDCNELKQLRA